MMKQDIVQGGGGGQNRNGVGMIKAFTPSAGESNSIFNFNAATNGQSPTAHHHHHHYPKNSSSVTSQRQNQH